LTGTDTAVRLPNTTIIIYAYKVTGTSRFYEMQGMEKPAGYEKEQ
jgi:hypothetical protein